VCCLLSVCIVQCLAAVAGLPTNLNNTGCVCCRIAVGYRIVDYGSQVSLSRLLSTMIVKGISFTKMETSSKQDVHKISLLLPMLLGIYL